MFRVCLQVLDKYNPPDHFLPESYTCFFLLKLPRYSCKQVLEEKLKYAIHFCKSIDTDDYARIALSGEPAADDSSEDSDNEDADSFASDSTQDYLTGHWRAAERLLVSCVDAHIHRNTAKTQMSVCGGERGCAMSFKSVIS